MPVSVSIGAGYVTFPRTPIPGRLLEDARASIQEREKSVTLSIAQRCKTLEKDIIGRTSPVRSGGQQPARADSGHHREAPMYSVSCGAGEGARTEGAVRTAPGEGEDAERAVGES